MIIGQYRIIEKIGEGGMGVIYKAEHSTLEQVVAIKSLTVNISDKPELRERFVREAKIQAKLSHPNVVNILNFLDIDGNYYIVMEYVEGETLEAMIKSKGLIPPDQCVGMFKQVLSGTGYAHSMGVVHRDIKPSNIIIKKDGTVKLTDFGIAKLSGDLQHTRTGVKVGTLWYMSPEQVKGQPASVASDIYSLGATLFEVLTGQVPFSGNSEYSIMKSIVESMPPSPREIYPYVPIHLEKVITTAMAKDPQDRFKSVEEFASALESPPMVQAASPAASKAASPRASKAASPRASLTASLQPPPPPSAPSYPIPGRRTVIAVAAAAVFLIALLVVVSRQKTGTAESARGATAPLATTRQSDAAAAAPEVAADGGSTTAVQPVPEPEEKVTVKVQAPLVAGRHPGEEEAKPQHDEHELKVREILRKGKSLHSNGDYGGAIRMFKKVQDLAPENAEAKEGIRNAEQAREVERQLGTLK